VGQFDRSRAALKRAPSIAEQSAACIQTHNEKPCHTLPYIATMHPPP